jgi:hypothetical protein
MKYSEVINLVDRELRDQEAWPDDSSALQRQLDLLYLAYEAIASEIPLNRLDLETKYLDGDDVAPYEASYNGLHMEMDNNSTPQNITSRLKRYSLPNDIFDLREEDLGINYVSVNRDIIYPDEFLPIQSIKHCAKNKVQESEVRVGFDNKGTFLYVMNGLEVELNYAPLKEKPNTQDSGNEGSYKDMEYPLNIKDTQRAVHLVAYHVSGVTIRDSAAAQFHALLENEYAG